MYGPSLAEQVINFGYPHPQLDEKIFWLLNSLELQYDRGSVNQLSVLGACEKIKDYFDEKINLEGITRSYCIQIEGVLKSCRRNSMSMLLEILEWHIRNARNYRIMEYEEINNPIQTVEVHLYTLINLFESEIDSDEEWRYNLLDKMDNIFGRVLSENNGCCSYTFHRLIRIVQHKIQNSNRLEPVKEALKSYFDIVTRIEENELTKIVNEFEENRRYYESLY